MKAVRVVFLVFGILFVIASLGFLISGGVIMTLENTFKDAQGYYSTAPFPVETRAAALVTGQGDIGTGPVWIRPHLNATVRIKGINDNPDRPIFIGIARTTDINRYLEGIAYSQTDYYSSHQNTLTFHHFQGLTSAPAPASQNFWIASVQGTGAQTLEWEISSGRYSAVLMNADGSSPIYSEVSVGIKIPGVFHALGIGLLVTGTVLLLGGGLMIFWGARGL
ncbi:MAG TPA: hypothetical protein VLH15_09060 [Dehalococcoidales bacterium]|nr:hypothetical protein [Dehalococcoidales bacterium]